MNVFNYATPVQSTAGVKTSLLNRIGKSIIGAMRNKRETTPINEQSKRWGENRRGGAEMAHQNSNTRLYPGIEAASNALLITTLQSMR